MYANETTKPLRIKDSDSGHLNNYSERFFVFWKIDGMFGVDIFHVSFCKIFRKVKNTNLQTFFLKKKYTTTLHKLHPNRKIQKKWTGVNDSDILLQTEKTENELIMKISRIDHRHEKRIRVDFPYNAEITAKLKLNDDVRWIKK